MMLCSLSFIFNEKGCRSIQEIFLKKNPEFSNGISPVVTSNGKMSYNKLTSLTVLLLFLMMAVDFLYLSV